VGTDEPDGQHPSAQRQLESSKIVTNLDRELLVALGALVGPLIPKVIQVVMPAMGAELPVFPTDGGEMIHSRLLRLEWPSSIREGW